MQNHTRPGHSHTAGIIALFLVAVLSAGTLITSYVNPSLFEHFGDAGGSVSDGESGGKGEGEAGKTGEDKKADSGKTPEEVLEGVNILPVTEDDLFLADAFEFDAGLAPEECIPGQFDVEINLERLGIAEEDYDRVVAMRKDADSNRFY